MSKNESIENRKNIEAVVTQDEFITKNKKRIVFDGIIDEITFEKMGDKKVVFLLKEAVENKNMGDYPHSYNLTEVAKKEAETQENEEPKKWKSICYWIEALLNPEKTYMDAKKCGGNLKKIAIVNIKKTAGNSSSDNNLLDKIVENNEYKVLLKEQIKKIAPSLVICGGTFDQAIKLYNICNDDVKHLACGAKYFQKDNIYFLSFIHPSIRVGKEVTYAYAQTVIKEFYKKISEDN